MTTPSSEIEKQLHWLDNHPAAKNPDHDFHKLAVILRYQRDRIKVLEGELENYIHFNERVNLENIKLKDLLKQAAEVIESGFEFNYTGIDREQLLDQITEAVK